MSDYVVPFDYDGKNFVQIDFYDKGKRILFIYSFVTKTLSQKIDLYDDDGYFSHLKFLPGNKYFVVRNYKDCEIRNDKLEVIKSFTHIGVEILDFGFILKEMEI